VSFSTHILPLKILVDYLVEVTGCAVTVIGIQPKLLEFAYPMTNAVKAAADRFVKDVQEAIA
jgi:Ni,Fe-hydrogenase maturation factor